MKMKMQNIYNNDDDNNDGDGDKAQISISSKMSLLSMLSIPFCFT